MSDSESKHACYLKGLEYVVPQSCLQNDDLVRDNPEFDANRIFEKTGIRSRFVVAEGETAGDLALEACRKLLINQQSILVISMALSLERSRQTTSFRAFPLNSMLRWGFQKNVGHLISILDVPASHTACGCHAP